PDRRAHAGDLGRHAAAHAARQVRQAPRHRRRHVEAPAFASGRGHRRRAGLPRLRDLAVVRAQRAGEHAGADRAAPGGGSGQGGEQRAGARAFQGRRRRGRGFHAAGICGVHQEGAGALEQGRARGERKGGLMYDVIVVGGGNAALCAALSASETRKKILVLERAPEEESGGNSRFTAGLFRVAYNGVEDLKKVITDLSPEEIANTDFGVYNEGQFLDDMARVTEYRCDPDLTEILVKQSLPTAAWMRSRGVRFTAAWGRQAFKIGGKFKFWGGLTVEAVGGGPGLVDSLTQIAKKAGIEIWYGARALSLVSDDAGVHGVVVKREGKTQEVKSKSVVLAAGGFQANTE